jgi:beta-phosphoglucomutase-like phosphatase (HAD superfamily)
LCGIFPEQGDAQAASELRIDELITDAFPVLTTQYLAKNALPDFEAVIFDMDGVVLDTEPSYVHAWKQAAAEFGVPIDEEFCHGLFGRHADDVARALREKIGSGFDRTCFNELATKYWRAYLALHGIAKMTGLDKLLEVLKRDRIPYALATNSDGPYARECLHLGGVTECFPLVVTRDQVATGKPAPDLFLEAARRLGASPARCLILEDSEAGLLAARKAECLPVLVGSGSAVPARLTSLALAVFPSLASVAHAIEGTASTIRH